MKILVRVSIVIKRNSLYQVNLKIYEMVSILVNLFASFSEEKFISIPENDLNE